MALTFSYCEEDIKNTIPEALGIAYQDEANTWQAKGGAVLDKVAQTLTITKTHFSDWSLFESFYLASSGTVVPVSGTVQLEVFTTDDLLIPHTAGEEIAMGKKNFDGCIIYKEWKLAGAGNLQSNATPREVMCWSCGKAGWVHMPLNRRWKQRVRMRITW